MKYKELKKEILKIQKEKGLKNGLKLDCGALVNDAEGFIKSHLSLLDSLMARYAAAPQGEKMRIQILAKQPMKRLMDYHKKVKKMFVAIEK